MAFNRKDLQLLIAEKVRELDDEALAQAASSILGRQVKSRAGRFSIAKHRKGHGVADALKSAFAAAKADGRAINPVQTQ